MPEKNALEDHEGRISRNEEEIRLLREWKHEMISIVNALGLRFDDLKLDMDIQCKQGDKILSSVQNIDTALRGDNKGPGLNEDVRQLKRAEEKRDRMFRLLVTILTTQIVGAALIGITWLIKHAS